METNKKVAFSALKPSGKMTIGNYIGAIRNMVALQEKYACVYSVADLHSITVDILPQELRANTYDMFALMIAFGIDTEQSILFIQSHVPAHAELAWALNCYTLFGEARRMTQFKDKSTKQPENVNLGLFDYPVLMAADILLYRSDYVPIGKDQQQHLELSRTIAQRFNHKYSPTFTVPEGIYPAFGAKINSLSDPLSKMGKTDADKNGVVLVLDQPEEILRKFKRAVTDSEGSVRYDPKHKPGISNLLTIFSAFQSISIEEAEQACQHYNYADFKTVVADAVIEKLAPIQKRYRELMGDKSYLHAVMGAGAERAARAAGKMLSKVYRKIGFIPIND